MLAPTNNDNIILMQIKSAIIVSTLISCFSVSAVSADQLDDHLQFLHSKLIDAIPMVVDDFTALTGVTVEGNTFVRTFTIDVPPESVNGVEFGQSMEPSLIGYVCNTANQQQLLELGGSYRFNYEAQDMFPLFSIDISAADCP